VLRVALVLEDRQGIELFRVLQQSSEFLLVGLAVLSGDFGWLAGKEKENCFITSDPRKITSLPELEAVVSAVRQAEINRDLRRQLRPGVELVEIPPEGFLPALFRHRTQLLENRLLKGELEAILNAVPEAIEVADADGTIRYVNPSFSRVTGIPAYERVNRNIFDVSPHGALAQCLIRQKPITGYRTYAGGSEVEVISNASPIIVDGEITGAVVVFQPVDDVLRLMEQLKQKNTVIENLYAQIDRISGSRWSFDDITGQSAAIRTCIEMGRRAARSEAPILICGESGTGKDVFAQAIHNGSPRRGRPLLRFDCAAVPESLQELELFGCEKGALPGAVHTRLGKAELARGGTLFIKNITSLSPYLQDKLLELVRERSFTRIGGEEPVRADLRLIASAPFSLQTAVRKGRFREELCRQLPLVELQLPPLRRRVEDIPLLIQEFIEANNRKTGKQVREVSTPVLQALMEYDWPGNISELGHVIERAMALAEGPIIEYHHLSPYIGKLSGEPPLWHDLVPLDRMEQILLKQALNRYGVSLEGKKKAAQALNISLATLYNKLKKYQVNL